MSLPLTRKRNARSVSRPQAGHGRENSLCAVTCDASVCNRLGSISIRHVRGAPRSHIERSQMRGKLRRLSGVLRHRPELKSALRWSMIDAGISAGGCNGEPGHVMRPAPIMACALRLVGKAAMGHAQQRAAVALDQIDLDQARSRRHLLATLPTEGVDEAVDRHDLSERAARNPGA